MAERFGVQISTDDLTAAHELVTPLREAGFRDIEIARLELAEANDAQFQMIQGPLAKTPEAIHLQVLAQQIFGDDLGPATRQAISEMPLEVTDSRPDGHNQHGYTNSQ